MAHDIIAYERQRGILDAAVFGEREVHIVGVGSGGSPVPFILKRQGIRHVTAWDGDTVSRDNMHNQLYPHDTIGMPKVLALSRVLWQWVRADIEIRQEFIDGPRDLSGVVFLCVDKMEQAGLVWDSCIADNDRVELVLNMRMDASYCTIFMLDPRKDKHKELWKRFYHPSSEAENDVTACGTTLSCPATPLWVAAETVWQLIRWHAWKQGRDVPLFAMKSYNFWTGEWRHIAW